jgi:hypothetical protein
MTVIGRAPWVNRTTGYALYAVAALIGVFNIEYSRRYLLMSFSRDSNTEFAFWASLLMSVGMAVFESAITAPLTTPLAWGWLLDAPTKLNQVQPESKRKLITAVTIAFLGIVAVMGFFCYMLDWTSTAGGSGIQNLMVRRFFTAFMVFGSEMFTCLASMCIFISKIGAANMLRLHADFDREIEQGKNYYADVEEMRHDGAQARAARAARRRSTNGGNKTEM